MPKSSKPRKKYRRKHTLVNPVAYVLEGFNPVDSYPEYMLNLKLKNHSAIDALVKGRASYQDINLLLAMNNAVVALLALGHGTEYDDVATTGYEALKAVTERGLAAQRFICRAEEINALNHFMELHDAQMAVITVNDMNRAIDLIKAKKLPRTFDRKVCDDERLPQQH